MMSRHEDLGHFGMMPPYQYITLWIRCGCLKDLHPFFDTFGLTDVEDMRMDRGVAGLVGNLGLGLLPCLAISTA